VAVADPKLANSIAQIPGLSLKLISDSSTQNVYRAIREHMTSLIPELIPAEMDSTRLGLAHSLSRHKLKFSPDKVDTMIIQSIASLDVLDKQLNTYAMRVKEWYGWHFPELAKILNDNLAYSKVVLKMGFRTNARETDLSGILPEEIEAAVKAAAEISMGTEITDEDLEATGALAEQVVDLTEYAQSSSQPESLANFSQASPKPWQLPLHTYASTCTQPDCARWRARRRAPHCARWFAHEPRQVARFDHPDSRC
jgi:nucleolar protein 58